MHTRAKASRDGYETINGKRVPIADTLFGGRKPMALDDEERAIIEAIRKLRGEGEPEYVMPTDFLVHGVVDSKHAGQLLGLSAKEVRELVKAHELRAFDLERIPLSELRRYYWKRAQEEEVSSWLRVAEMFWPKWLPRRMVATYPHGDYLNGPGHSPKSAAEQLGISEREVRRLIAEKVLFAFHSKHGHRLTSEEIETFDARRRTKEYQADKKLEGYVRGIVRGAA